MPVNTFITPCGSSVMRNIERTATSIGVVWSFGNFLFISYQLSYYQQVAINFKENAFHTFVFPKKFSASTTEMMSLCRGTSYPIWINENWGGIRFLILKSDQVGETVKLSELLNWYLTDILIITTREVVVGWLQYFKISPLPSCLFLSAWVIPSLCISDLVLKHLSLINFFLSPSSHPSPFSLFLFHFKKKDMYNLTANFITITS